MTEIADKTETRPPPEALDTFILQWGELGSTWGMNRSIAQIHAFLYLAERPLTAEDIAEGLGIARSNVSNSLRELLGWDLVRKVPVRGDRREHYEAETDVWEIAARIAEGRKQREIDPALRTLRACVELAEADRAVSDTQRERLRNMLEFTEGMERWTLQMLSLPKSQREKLLKLGAKVAKLLPGRGGGES